MRKCRIESWLLLLRVELVMVLRGLKGVHQFVSKQHVRAATLSDRPPVDFLCGALDCASVFYFKRVLCLQRSAATTVLLRRYGWTAKMVIGAQIVPFKSHAWVEVDGIIVNDKPYLLDIYRILERF